MKNKKKKKKKVIIMKLNFNQSYIYIIYWKYLNNLIFKIDFDFNNINFIYKKNKFLIF